MRYNKDAITKGMMLTGGSNPAATNDIITKSRREPRPPDYSDIERRIAAARQRLEEIRAMLGKR